MEKYSKWRDEGTGIHPFLPAVSTRSGASTALEEPSGVTSVIRTIVGSVVAVLVLPFVLVISLWLILVNFIAMAIPIAIIQRPFKRYTEFIGCRVLLFLLGFWNIQSRVVKLQTQKSQLGTKSNSINAGDVIVCNHTSYVDILYLSFKYSPVFAFGLNSWKESAPKGLAVMRPTILSAIKESITDTEKGVEQATSLSKIIEYAKQQYAPVVVFPEGCTSNGKTLLSFASVFDGLEKRPAYHIVGLKYDFEDFSPSFSVGNPFIHLFKLCSQFGNNLEARIVSTDDIVFDPSLDNSGQISTWLAAVLRVRKARLTSKDKQEFLKYWFEHKKSYKKKQ